MGTLFFRISMFISSYFPLYVFLVILNFKDYRNLGVFFWSTNIILLFSILTLVMFFKNSKPNRVCEVKDFELVREEVLSYFVTYVVPLTMNITENKTLIVNALLFCIIGVIYVRNELIHLNPMLILLGYKQYTMENSIILTRYSRTELRQLQRAGEKISYREIAKGIKVVSKKKQF